MILENAQPSKQYKVMPIMISLLTAGFIGMFSETALNIALTDLMKELHITPATVQWLTTGYLLVLGILVPVSGLLLQWFTTRQLFIVSLAFSIIGTLIAALAPSFPFLLAARIVQALGTGLLLPLMFNTILVIFPPHKRGAAMGTIGLVIMFAPAIGPTFSGLVLEHLNWHWIFWISLPFLVLALLFGIAYMQNVSDITKPKIDVLSIILSTIGFGGIVFGFSNAGEGSDGWSSPTVIGSLTVGAIALILFSIRQLTMKQPMMNLRAFRYPMFVLGVVIVFICMMVILSTMLLLPMYLQSGLMLTAFTSGLILLPGGILNGFMSPVTGRLFDKYGPKWLVIPGLSSRPPYFGFLKHYRHFNGHSHRRAPHMPDDRHFHDHDAGANEWLKPAAAGILPGRNGHYEYAPADGRRNRHCGGGQHHGSRAEELYEHRENPNDPSAYSHALIAGVQHAFIFAMIVAVIGLISAFFMKRVKVNHS